PLRLICVWSHENFHISKLGYAGFNEGRYSSSIPADYGFPRFHTAALDCNAVSAVATARLRGSDGSRKKLTSNSCARVRCTPCNSTNEIVLTGRSLSIGMNLHPDPRFT